MYGGIVVFPWLHSVGILNMGSFLLGKHLLSFLPMPPCAGVFVGAPLSYFWAMSEVMVGMAIVALPQAALAITFNRQILGSLIHCHIYPQLFFSEHCPTLGT